MEILRLDNFIAKAIQIFAWVSLILGFILLLFSFKNITEDFLNFVCAIALVVNAIFMFGLSYIVEAAAIYIEKNRWTEDDDEVEEDENIE